jgi:hypothetical protein
VKLSLSIRIVIVATVLVGLAHHGSARASTAEVCKAKFKEQVGGCASEVTSNPTFDPSDTSYWQRCQDKYRPEYEQCLGSGAATGASVSPPPTPQCQEAMVAIDWVFADAGATGTFARFREEGNSAMDSVIGAQGHNPNAQAALRACAGWGSNYLMAVYGGAVEALTRPVTDTGPQSCEALPSGLCYDGCQVSCPQGYAAFCTNAITWNMQCWRASTCFCGRP